VVDVQNCFLPGGSLAVKDGDQVIPVINRIAKAFDNVVMTQDCTRQTTCRLRQATPGVSHSM
jgi:nicotinamidase-related amidase